MSRELPEVLYLVVVGDTRKFVSDTTLSTSDLGISGIEYQYEYQAKCACTDNTWV